ncbi:hypothetical protein D3C80_1823040 [compost metagenome]
MRFQLTQYVAKDVTWHHNQHITAGRQCDRKIGFEQQIVGERDIRKECLITTGAL